MKKETNEKFEASEEVVFIALICAILTMIFGYHPKEEIIDNIFFYGLGTLLFTFAYYLIISIIISIIGIIVITICCLIDKIIKK